MTHTIAECLRVNSLLEHLSDPFRIRGTRDARNWVSRVERWAAPEPARQALFAA